MKVVIDFYGLDEWPKSKSFWRTQLGYSLRRLGKRYINESPTNDLMPLVDRNGTIVGEAVINPISPEDYEGGHPAGPSEY